MMASGAERYLAARLADPGYRAAYDDGRRRLEWDGVDAGGREATVRYEVGAGWLTLINEGRGGVGLDRRFEDAVARLVRLGFRARP